MKKTKFIAMALVVSVMMMGAGYAWWTDAVKIEGTVNTGTMSVGFYDSTIEEIDPLDVMTATTSLTDPATNALGIAHNKGVNINISNLYPGAKTIFDMEARNDGNLPVQIETITVDLTGTDQELLSNNHNRGIYVRGNIALYNSEGRSIKSKAFYSVRLKDLNGNLQSLVNSADWELKPGYYIGAGRDGITFELGRNPEDATNASQNKTANIKIDFTFKQPNKI